MLLNIFFVQDDFEETEPEDDSADRPLVIDEGNRNETPSNKESNNGNAVELSESEVPECQGCRKREAQFVCAGCANQWYCSRECQVNQIILFTFLRIELFY